MPAFRILTVPSRVEYACVGAYASVLVYVEIELLKDPIRGPVPTILPSGTQMRLGCVYRIYRGRVSCIIYKRKTCRVHEHRKRLNLVSPPKPGIYLRWNSRCDSTATIMPVVLVLGTYRAMRLPLDFYFGGVLNHANLAAKSAS